MSGWIGKILPGFKQLPTLPMDFQDGKTLYFNDPFYGEKTLHIFKDGYAYRSSDLMNWESELGPASSEDYEGIYLCVDSGRQGLTIVHLYDTYAEIRVTHDEAYKWYSWDGLPDLPYYDGSRRIQVDEYTIANTADYAIYLFKPSYSGSYESLKYYKLDLLDLDSGWQEMEFDSQVKFPLKTDIAQVSFGSYGPMLYVICHLVSGTGGLAYFYCFNPSFGAVLEQHALFQCLAGNDNTEEPYGFLPPAPDHGDSFYIFREYKTREGSSVQSVHLCRKYLINTLQPDWTYEKTLPYDPSNATPFETDGYIHLLGGNSTNSSIRNHYGEGFTTLMPIKNAWTRDLTLLSDGKAKRVVRGWIGDSENKPKEALTPNFLTELSVDTSYEDASIAEFHRILRHNDKLYAFGKENSSDTELKLYEWTSSGWEYLDGISLSSCGYVEETVSFNGFVYILTYTDGGSLTVSFWSVYKIDLDLEEVTQVGESNLGADESQSDFSRSRFLVWKDHLYVTSAESNKIYKLTDVADDVYWNDVTYSEFGLSANSCDEFFFVLDGELHRLSNGGASVRNRFHTSKFNPITKEWAWTDYDGGELVISEISSSESRVRFQICNYDGTVYAILQNQISWDTGLPAPYNTNIKIYVYRYEPLGYGFNYMCWRKVQEVKTNSHYIGTSFDFVGDAAVFNGLINVITGSYWSYGFSFQDDIYQFEFTLIPPTT